MGVINKFFKEYPELNPNNWGVKDYTDKYPDKDKAFAAARKAGEKEYLYKGVRYPVLLKNYPGKVIKERDDFTGSFLSGHANEFVKGKHTALGSLLFGSDALKNREKAYGDVYDLYNYYLGQPLKSNSLSKSKYYPKDAKENFNNYIAINEDEFIDEVLNLANEYGIEEDKTIAVNASLDQKKINPFLTPAPEGKKEGDPYIDRRGNKLYYGKSVEERKKIRDKYNKTSALRNFRIGRSSDDRGEYISYYDLFDRGTGLNDKESSTFGTAKPFEVYDRIHIKDYGDGEKKKMYYSDRELSQLDVNNKNFDTLALQRELSNRGYKLPKSTKADGTFDGVLGEETKQALKDYQSTKKYQKGGVVSPLEGDLYSKVLMERNRDKDFVKRAFNPDPKKIQYNADSTTSTHIMEWGEDDRGQAYMYPTIFNEKKESIKVPNQYADYISSEGYKNATGMNKKAMNLKKYKKGCGGIKRNSNMIKKYFEGGEIKKYPGGLASLLGGLGGAGAAGGAAASGAVGAGTSAAGGGMMSGLGNILKGGGPTGGLDYAQKGLGAASAITPFINKQSTRDKWTKTIGDYGQLAGMAQGVGGTIKDAFATDASKVASATSGIPVGKNGMRVTGKSKIKLKKRARK